VAVAVAAAADAVAGAGAGADEVQVVARRQMRHQPHRSQRRHVLQLAEGAVGADAAVAVVVAAEPAPAYTAWI
jgi:hypothetical protein